MNTKKMLDWPNDSVNYRCETSIRQNVLTASSIQVKVGKSEQKLAISSQ